MKRKPIQFTAYPTIRADRISAKDYLKLSDAERRTFSEVRIAAPTLGQDSFGGLLVRYKTPVYKIR